MQPGIMKVAAGFSPVKLHVSEMLVTCSTASLAVKVKEIFHVWHRRNTR